MELLFYRVYETAEMMAAVVDGDFDPFGELDWDSANISGCMTKFSRISLLGHFCLVHLSIYERRRFRKDPETVDVESVSSAFQQYDVAHKSFADFLHDDYSGDRDEEAAYHAWLVHQEAAFDELWTRITDEACHILFGNRGFLLKFNLALAEYRKERGDSPSRRCRIPQWVKKAVYFRENGRCALCKRDLSGLIALDAKQHYDHIVPLKALGINDPCNIQLLCAQCNLNKGASTAHTSSTYDPW